VGVQGYLDFMRTGFDYAYRSRQKSTIGGEHGHELLATGYPNELRQMGMQEGLAHQVEIKELDLSTKLVGQEVELLHGKTTLRSIRLGTEQAIEVANVGYFKIAPGYHSI